MNKKIIVAIVSVKIFIEKKCSNIEENNANDINISKFKLRILLLSFRVPIALSYKQTNYIS